MKRYLVMFDKVVFPFLLDKDNDMISFAFCFEVSPCNQD